MTSAQAKQPEADRQNARANDLWRVPMLPLAQVGSRLVLRNPVSGECAFMDAALYEAIGRSHPEAQALDARGLAAIGERGISDAQRAGLLLSERVVLKHIAAAPAQQPCAIGAVAIVTSNRPQTLRRSLAMILAVRRTFARTHSVVVIDDSHLRAAMAVRATCDELGRREGVPVEYVGREERAQLVRDLAERGACSRRLGEFVVFGDGSHRQRFGAALNSAVLWTAGVPFAVFDDDVVATAGVLSGRDEQALVFGDDGDPTEMRVHASWEEVRAAVNWRSDVDPLACHEQALGASLGYLARAAGPHARVKRGRIKCTQQLPMDTARVVATCLGVAGDCGLWSTHNYILLPRNVLRPMLTSRAKYRRLRGSRWVARAAPSPTVTGGGFLMNAALALDNRSSLLPFVPMWRNMDGVFSHCLLTCCDDAYAAFLPVVVQHLPPSRRSTGRAPPPDHAAVVRATDILTHLIYNAPGAGSPGSMPAKLQRLGKHLRACAAGDQLSFEHLLAGARQQILSQHLAYLERRQVERSLSDAPAYSAWVRDIDAQKAAIAYAITHVQRARAPDAAPLRRAFRNIGAMMAAWPHVWKAASMRCR